MGLRPIITHSAHDPARRPRGITLLVAVSHDWTFVALWSVLGVAVGVAGTGGTRLLLRAPTAATAPAVRAAGPLLTGLAFALLANRFPIGPDLVAYSYLSAVGVVLAVVDLADHRLPSALVLPSYMVVGALFTVAAIAGDTDTALVRALLAATALAVAYLLIAITSRGGLGSGDVKLGGLLGLAMGWQEWPVALTGTLLAWSAAAITIVLRRAASRPRNDEMPMGPFLLAGALAAVLLS